jgi:S1-C subfamily serine protease
MHPIRASYEAEPRLNALADGAEVSSGDGCSGGLRVRFASTGSWNTTGAVTCIVNLNAGATHDKDLRPVGLGIRPGCHRGDADRLTGGVPGPSQRNVRLLSDPTQVRRAAWSSWTQTERSAGTQPTEFASFMDKRCDMSDLDDATRPAGGYGQPPAGGYGQPPAGGYGQPPAGGYGQAPAYGQPPETSGPPAGPPRGRTSGAVWALAAAVVAGLVLFAGGTGIGWSLARGNLAGQLGTVQAPIRTVPQIGSSSGQTGPARPADAQAIASKVVPAVVDIDTVIQTLGRPDQAAGTGMILTASGEALTNNHVIQGASSIKVTLPSDGSSYPAKVIGVDPSADIALLQIQGRTGLPTVTLADSSTLTTGQAVVAIGNALGQGGAPSVTEGTITGLDRSITASDGNGSPEQLSGLIQSDASISPGDSGGPLVNTAGQVVGMITAGSTGRFSRSASTVGFAIPSNTAADVVNQIRSGRASSSIILGQPGYLGVQVTNLDPATANQLGLSVSGGALVTGVAGGSPAAQAGIARGSVITAIDGGQVASARALGPAIQSHKPGQSIRVTWVDGAGTHNASVSLASGPAA